MAAAESMISPVVKTPFLPAVRVERVRSVVGGTDVDDALPVNDRRGEDAFACLEEPGLVVVVEGG
jgi:hypothetical protein